MTTSSPKISNRFWLASKVAAFALAVAVVVGSSGASCGTAPPGGGGDNTDPCDITKQNGGTTPVVLSGETELGSQNAPVTVMEFADPQCPFCARFTNNSFGTIKSEFIDTGKVRWIYRHFPLDNIHPNARTGARACECAGLQNKFFEYLGQIFATYDNNTGKVTLLDGNSSTAIANLKQLAVNQGLDANTFNSCLDNNTTANAVESDFQSGVSLGVTGTPSFFITYQQNGQTITKVVAGAASTACFETLLNSTLREAGVQ